MASVFWDVKGILLIVCLPSGQTNTGQYYANLIDQLQEKIHEKRPGLARKNDIFHQDNAHPHTSVIAMTKIHELRNKLLLHLPYSPNLAPSDFHLFPKLKIFSVDRDFLQRKNWQLKWRGILQAWRNLIFEMGSRHWNIARPNALVYRETILKNKNSSTEIRHFFHVHFENFSNHPHS